MATVELTKDNFDEIVGGADTVLIDFWAGWCAPCRMFGPVFERVSATHPDIVFAKADTEAQPELAASFQVMSIPTLAVIRDRVVLYAQPGALRETDLQHLIGKVREIDMDEVRRRLAAQTASA